LHLYRLPSRSSKGGLKQDIYQHASLERDAAIADGVSELVTKELRKSARCAEWAVRRRTDHHCCGLFVVCRMRLMFCQHATDEAPAS
jgi:hypothetical protein